MCASGVQHPWHRSAFNAPINKPNAGHASGRSAHSSPNVQTIGEYCQAVVGVSLAQLCLMQHASFRCSVVRSGGSDLNATAQLTRDPLTSLPAPLHCQLLTHRPFLYLAMSEILEKPEHVRRTVFFTFAHHVLFCTNIINDTLIIKPILSIVQL